MARPEKFITRFRERLYLSALRIAREDSAAHELADTLYADLYGTTTREGCRISKLASYTGRGSLEGWLRTVLAQEYVNRYRRTKRLVSLDEESEEGVQFSAPEPQPVPAADNRLARATDEAIASLPAEDRLVLSAHYLDGRTLAEIARMLAVHESTISRKLDKLAKSLRKQIIAALTRPVCLAARPRRHSKSTYVTCRWIFDVALRKILPLARSQKREWRPGSAKAEAKRKPALRLGRPGIVSARWKKSPKS